MQCNGSTYTMFSLFICIIVNIVFILFYLQVEPVYLRVLIKLSKSLLCHQYRQQFYNVLALSIQQYGKKTYKCPTVKSHSHDSHTYILKQ